MAEQVALRRRQQQDDKAGRSVVSTEDVDESISDSSTCTSESERDAGNYSNVYIDSLGHLSCSSCFECRALFNLLQDRQREGEKNLIPSH